MTVQAFLEEYRAASVELEVLRGYLRADRSGAPAGLRTARTDARRGTNEPEAAAVQHEAYCEQELARRTERMDRRRPLLEEMLGTLGAREALVMRGYVNGDTTETIALQMRISPATVSRSKRRALEQLAARWGEVAVG